MSVFLRWGIFGILGVAALVYAYNASKRMAERHASREIPKAVVASATGTVEPEQMQQPESSTSSPVCDAELVVARRALEARAAAEPLDRLLRIQEIAFEEPSRRARLEKIARDWFDLVGPDPTPAALRAAVISSCEKASPAP